MSNDHRPIIIVTGASGISVGFGICHRLLLQLSRSQCTDALPRPEISSIYSAYGTDNIPLGPCDGLTLVLACRNFSRAKLAKDQLLQLLDDDIAKQRKLGTYDGHGDIFRKNLQIDIQLLDLASLSSVFKFGEEIVSKYPYISHLIFNAAATTMCAIDWHLVPGAFFTDGFVSALTFPRYYKQTKGVLSADGFGWVWQCNVFGNYCVYRLLASHLSKYYSMYSYHARVIWVSSLHVIDEALDMTDWQIKGHDLPYEVSKREVDLLVGYFERKNASLLSDKGKEVEVGIIHVLSQPGIVSTNFQRTLIGVWLMAIMRSMFIIASLLGSLNHSRTTYQASFSTTYAALAPIPSNFKKSAEKNPDLSIVKYHTQTSLSGWQGLRAEVISGQQHYWEDADKLGEKCEALFQSLLQKRNENHTEIY